MGRVIIIAGPPGAGKTTTTRLLAERNEKGIYVEGDRFWSMFPKGTIVAKPFRLAMRSMLASSLPFAKEGYDVYVDYAMPPWFIETAKKIALNGRDLELHYVIIQPKESICRERALARVEGRIENYDEFTNLYGSFNEMPNHHIGTDESTVDELLETILQEVPLNRFRITE